MFINKKWMRQVFFVLIFGLPLMMVACGNVPAATISKASQDKQVYVDPIRFGGLKDISTFDPALATDSASVTAIDMIFTGLVSLNDKLQVQNQLASFYTISPDGLTYTFHLRSNLTFSDGTPLTSNDVAYSINRALTPALNSKVALSYLGLIKDADKLFKGQVKTLIGDSLLVPDPHTITITLSHSAAYFLQALTYPCSYVVEKSMIEKYGNTGFSAHLKDGIGGAGPFVVSSYTPGKDIQFTPNKNYYGPQPQLRKVVFPFYSSIDAEYNAFNAKQVDAAQITATQTSSAQALSDHQYQTVPQLVITYVAFNYLVKPFDNIHIRQAFALALDKDALVQSTAKGLMIPTNHIVPQGMPGYDPNLTGPTGVANVSGDVAQAKALLKQGLQEEGMHSLPPITFTVATNGNSTNQDQVAAMQKMWKSIGINVTVDDINFLALNAKLEASVNNPTGLMMWRLNWVADYADPQDWLTLQFARNAANNQQNYGQNNSSDAVQQQATQQLMGQADANMNSTSRMQQYNQAEQQLINDVAWLPIDQAILPYATKPCVVGQVYNAAWLTPPNDWANIYISTNPLCANTSAY
jgi:oligopeptide transport system substrate-binding protein